MKKENCAKTPLLIRPVKKQRLDLDSSEEGRISAEELGQLEGRGVKPLLSLCPVLTLRAILLRLLPFRIIPSYGNLADGLPDRQQEGMPGDECCARRHEDHSLIRLREGLQFSKRAIKKVFSSVGQGLISLLGSLPQCACFLCVAYRGKMVIDRQ